MIYATGMMIISVIFETIPQTLLGFFNASEAMIKLEPATSGILLNSFHFCRFLNCFGATFQAVKGTYNSLLTSLIRQLLYYYPCAYVLCINR